MNGARLLQAHRPGLVQSPVRAQRGNLVSIAHTHEMIILTPTGLPRRYAPRNDQRVCTGPGPHAAPCPARRPVANLRLAVDTKRPHARAGVTQW